MYLEDRDLEPVFEELERRKTVVYEHPNPSPDHAAHALGLPDNLLDFPTDTNRAVAQMHYTNRFARTPNVKYIFSHAEGSIPYLAARFAIIDEMGFIAGGEQRGAAADMFRRIYWDTAPAASDPVHRMLRDVRNRSSAVWNGFSVSASRPSSVPSNGSRRVLRWIIEKDAAFSASMRYIFSRVCSLSLSGNASKHQSSVDRMFLR